MTVALELAPAWQVVPPSLDLVYSFSVPMQTPSNNEIKEMHWFEYKRLRGSFRNHVWVGLKGRRPAQPLARSFLHVRRHCSGQLDWDNAYGGLKPLLDTLVSASKRNPDGLGLVADDNPKTMPFPPFVEQVPAPVGKGKTEVFVYSIN